MTVITEIINAILHLYVSFLFFSSFWKRKYSDIGTAVYFIITVALFACSTLLLKEKIIVYMLAFLLTAALTPLFYGKLVRKLMCSAFLFGVFALSFGGTKQGALYITGIFISKFAILIIVFFVRLKKQSLLQRFRKKHFEILLFPLSTLVMILLQHIIFMSIPQQDILMPYVVLITYTLLTFANLIVFDFIDSLCINIIGESRIAAAEELIASQTCQYQALVDHNRDIARIQHDNKNFCLGIISEIKSGNTKTAVEKLEAAYDLYSDEQAYGGNIIYALVNNKMRAMCSDNIDILCEVHELQNIKIATTDLAIIIGNALDNAIEECERTERTDKIQISLFVTLKNDSVVIRVKNPVSDNVDVSSLTTKKSDSDHHGFGIISMKQIALKYGGEVIFECEDQIFTVSVIMNNGICTE